VPELPEVETTRRGIAPLCVGQRLERLIIRDGRLRWPVDPGLPEWLAGQELRSIERRAKYLLFDWGVGTLIMHLGMSGSLRIVTATVPYKTHDHLEFRFADECCLRLHDPRRFGAAVWSLRPIDQHPLIARLGPEPLSSDFSGEYLHALAHGRRSSVKQFLMDQAVVVGVGNIYASEALHLAGIHPRRAAGRVARARYERLADCVRQVLARAITEGGTTLRDFVNGAGEPGYFAQQLRVYDRAGAPCLHCGATIRSERIGQRSSFYCPDCQR
jgi:formamidopyrimidine-DNA glycosylase